MSDTERDAAVDETGATQGEAPADQGDDTEGHSLFIAELGRTMAGDRSREAGQWAKGEAARRQAKKDQDKRKR